MKKSSNKKEKKKTVIIREKKSISDNIKKIYNSTDGQTIPANKDDGIHRVIQVPDKLVKKIPGKNAKENE